MPERSRCLPARQASVIDLPPEPGRRRGPFDPRATVRPDPDPSPRGSSRGAIELTLAFARAAEQALEDGRDDEARSLIERAFDVADLLLLAPRRPPHA